jgi:hypothetical protein
LSSLAMDAPATSQTALHTSSLFALDITSHFITLHQEWSQKLERGAVLRSCLHPCIKCIVSLLRAVPSCRDLYVSALDASFEEDPDTSSLVVQIIMDAIDDGKQQESLWGTPVAASVAGRIAENACSSVFIVKSAITPAIARRLHKLFAGMSKDIFISK